MRKRIALTLIGVSISGSVLFGLLQLRSPIPVRAQTGVALTETSPSQAAVTANGMVRSNQSALLIWQVPGTVGEIQAAIGEQVGSGQELAILEKNSVPPNVLLAQADLVSAQKALDDLLASKLQAAQAQQAVEEAQKALDDLRSPQVSQAQAQEAIANAQKAVDQADLQVYILTTPPSQAAIDQAHASVLMAENKLDHTRKQLERMQNQLKKLRKIPAAFRPIFKRFIQKGIENLEFQVNRDQMAYDRQADKYNALLEPADPTALAVAQANLEKAQAQLGEAQRAWERVKDGATPAQTALAEARLADAQREWERLKNGPDPADLAAARAKVAAAQTAVNQVRITAPFDGRITEVSIQPGDQVQPGSLAFRLDDLSRLLVDAQVSEIDINRVKTGQPAIITFDAVPGKDYHGRVVEVAPAGTETEGVVSYAVKVELTDADPQVKPGMTADIEITVE